MKGVDRQQKKEASDRQKKEESESIGDGPEGTQRQALDNSATVARLFDRVRVCKQHTIRGEIERDGIAHADKQALRHT